MDRGGINGWIKRGIYCQQYNRPRSFKANFAINTYTLTFATTGKGTISGNTSQKVNHGADGATVKAVPAEGYHFDGWMEGSTVVSTSTALTLINITAAHNFTASFAQDFNGVCGTNNGSIFTVAPVSNLCTSGTASTVTGTGPWSWKCAGAGTISDCSADIRSYSVTASAGALSSITPATSQTVNHGSSVNFTVVPASGYGVMATGCGGTLNGSTYITGAIIGDCTVSVAAVSRNARGTGIAQPSILDAIKALNSYTGKSQLSAEEKICYDVAPLGNNGVPAGNGVVDVADIILILRRTVGLGNW